MFYIFTKTLKKSLFSSFTLKNILEFENFLEVKTMEETGNSEKKIKSFLKGVIK